MESTGNLVLELQAAAADYVDHWQSVDHVLYDACRGTTHDSFPLVYSKVVLVNRVYAAGISRASRATNDREVEVARGLIELAPRLDPRLASLAAAVTLDEDVLAEVVAVHDLITRGLLDRTNGRWLTSFASKYLHFHCPVTPIFDDRAVAGLGSHVSNREAAAARGRVSRPTTWVTPYWQFSTRFLALEEKVREFDIQPAPSVKLLDHMLWRYRSGEHEGAKADD